MRRRTMVVATASLLALALAFGASSARAQLGGTVVTPAVPPELPVEIETELGPGSLKQAPLWKELVQLLESPYEPVARRPGFGATMPELDVIPLGLNFLTDQPLRLRTSDGEVSWDQPGPLFDPEQTVESLDADGNGTPDLLRTRIGALVASEDDVLDEGDLARLAAMTGVTTGDNCFDCGYLIVHNPDGHPALPPNGTVVAVPAFFSPTTNAVCLTRATPGCEDAVLHELDPPPRSTRRSSSSRRPSTSRTSSGRRATCAGWEARTAACGRSRRPATPEGRPPRCSARRSSGTCRWGATACSPAGRATSTPEWTTGPGTRSTRTTWAETSPPRRSR